MKTDPPIIKLTKQLISKKSVTPEDRGALQVLSLQENMCSYMLQVLLTPSVFYHGIVRMPLFGCCPQHRTYRC